MERAATRVVTGPFGGVESEVLTIRSRASIRRTSPRAQRPVPASPRPDSPTAMPLALISRELRARPP